MLSQIIYIIICIYIISIRRNYIISFIIMIKYINNLISSLSKYPCILFYEKGNQIINIINPDIKTNNIIPNGNYINTNNNIDNLRQHYFNNKILKKIQLQIQMK